MKHFLSIESQTAEQLTALLESSIQFKANRGKASEPLLGGQTWALLFSKPSTRTRVSFEVGIRELGGSVIFLSQSDIQLGRGEPIIDTARVLGPDGSRRGDTHVRSIVMSSSSPNTVRFRRSTR